MIDDIAAWSVRDDLDGCTGRPREGHDGVHADSVVDFEFDLLAYSGWQINILTDYLLCNGHIQYIERITF